MSAHETPIRPYIRIVEQPSKSLRYRYSCEGRPGRIPGASSTPDNKIPSAIQIVGYEGKVVVLVSCVSKDSPYRPHPHKLVGLNCRKGVCSFETEISARNNIVTFPKLAVQCVKKNDVVEALKSREEKKVDPFLTGFDHKDDIKSIDLHVVRLCFQVFLVGENRSKAALSPVVSDPIFNRKFQPDPLIYRLSHCNSPVSGRSDDIILLCTKISKDDIRIRFFETRNDQLIWEDFGLFHQNGVYNHTAICFKPPKYHNLSICEPVKVSLQLLRPSDGVASPVVPFEYLPLSADPSYVKENRIQDHNLFAQFLQNSFEVPQACKIPKLSENALLLGVTSSYLPETLPHDDSMNDINAETSKRRALEDISTFNIISEDLNVGNNLNLDSPSDVCQVLNMDCNQIVLEPLNLNSGDLEMNDMEKLSGSLQDHLII